MILVIALLGYFCLVGLTARRFDMPARWLLLAGIVAFVVIDLVMRSFS